MERGETLLAAFDGGAYLYKLTETVYKLDMPPVTSMFFVRGDGGAWYLIDTGHMGEHAEGARLAAMEALGIAHEAVRGICITHEHWDHVDGLPVFLKYCKNAVVYGYRDIPPYEVDMARYRAVRDGNVIDGLISVVEMPGHSDDSIGFLDLRSCSLFSGDGIQMYGVSTSGMFIFAGIKTYLASMARLQSMDIDCIYSAHPYMPLGAYAMGAEAVRRYLATALDCVYALIGFITDKYRLGMTDAELLKRAFMEHGRSISSDFPVDGFRDAIKSVIEEYL